MTHFKEYLEVNKRSQCNELYHLCLRCGLAYGHPVQYCSKCPGKIEKVIFDCKYGEILEKYPTLNDWGEEYWREREYERNKWFYKETKSKIPIPCSIVLWCMRSLRMLDKYEFLKEYHQYGPSETFEPNRVEYGFGFLSTKLAIDTLSKIKYYDFSYKFVWEGDRA